MIIMLNINQIESFVEFHLLTEFCLQLSINISATYKIVECAFYILALENTFQPLLGEMEKNHISLFIMLLNNKKKYKFVQQISTLNVLYTWSENYNTEF